MWPFIVILAVPAVLFVGLIVSVMWEDRKFINEMVQTLSHPDLIEQKVFRKNLYTAAILDKVLSEKQCRKIEAKILDNLKELSLGHCIVCNDAAGPIAKAIPVDMKKMAKTDKK